MTMPPFHVHEIRRALDMAEALGHQKCRISTLSLRTVLRILKDHEQLLVRHSHLAAARVFGRADLEAPRRDLLRADGNEMAADGPA